MFEKMKAKSLFATKVFQGATIALLGGLAPIVLACAYNHRLPTQEEAASSAGLLTTFALTLVGRLATEPVYTPVRLPGPNRADLEI